MIAQKPTTPRGRRLIMKFILLFLMVFAAFSTTRAAEGDKEAALREMREARIASVLKNKIPIRETPPGKQWAKT